MTESAKHTNSSHKVAGIIEILISAYWSFHNAETFYDYRATLLDIFDKDYQIEGRVSDVFVQKMIKHHTNV